MSSTEQPEANKKLAREYIEQVFNQHNPAKAADFATADVVWHGGGLGDIAGAAGLVGLLESFIGALPDLYAAEQDLVAENDRVASISLWDGTITRTGSAVDFTSADFLRIEDGVAAEHWDTIDYVLEL